MTVGSKGPLVEVPTIEILNIKVSLIKDQNETIISRFCLYPQVIRKNADKLDMETEQIYQTLKVLFDHLEGIASAVGVFVSIGIALSVYKQSSREKRIEIYMDLFQQWDLLWTTLTAHPEQNRQLFQKDIKDFKDDQENLKLTIYQIINLLSRVHYFYEYTSQDMTKSDWQKEAEYMLTKPLFISAYRKQERRYSDNFKNYVKTILKEEVPQKGKIINLHKLVKKSKQNKHLITK